MCRDWSRMSVCMCGYMLGSTSTPASLPQCHPGGDVAASPHQRGVQQSRTLWRWLHPQPGRHISRDTFSQLCPQCITEDQLPLWLWRQNQQQQQEEEASCSSVPAPLYPSDFLDLQKAAGRKAGRRRGQEDRDLLPERTGRFRGWGRMTPFQQIACPPPKSLAPWMCFYRCPLRVLICRKEQMAQAGVLGDAPSSECKEEMKPLEVPGRTWVKGQKENMGTVVRNSQHTDVG